MTNPPEEIQVLDKHVRLLQPAEGLRTSIDAVLLAAACPAKAGESILDLGCGVGTAGLCALWRVPGTSLTGIDIQASHIDLARQNAVLNGGAERTDFSVGDVADLALHRDGHKPVFDHVICNPPFLEDGTYMKAAHPDRAKALGHQETSLQIWLDAAFYQLKDDGVLTMIHRADHTDKIIHGLGRRFGATEIIPLWPHAGEPAKRVIVRTIKGRKTGSTLNPGLVLHGADGGYTPAAEAVLRGGNAIN